MKKFLQISSFFLFGLFSSNSFASENSAGILATINNFLFNVLFFDISFGTIISPFNHQPVTIPLLIVLLGVGGVYFTLYFGFINFTGFKHAIDIIRGKFDKKDDSGEISHFEALTSALSATVGLGNIAGVAIAIQLGGPGAVFWMLVAALFGMSTKFTSCTLSQLYRKIKPDGTIQGGPMYYLSMGFNNNFFGIILSTIYAFMVMGGSIGAGNMFQANQAFEAFASAFGNTSWLAPSSSESFIFGTVLAVFVGLVIIGGIKRIGRATSKIVPIMCGIYVLASLFIIFTHFSEIPSAIKLIFKMAFTDNAMYGGVVGVLIWGIRRASFSNEAGLGSSAIVHAAAKTDQPVREGMVAMLEPFIDTIIVCSMTALVVIITGAWNDPNIPQKAGVMLTSQAFESVISWFPIILSICVILFAYSTMISWCYYGEQGWIFFLNRFKLPGEKYVLIFRIFFVIAIVVGTTHSLKDVLNFSDAMVLSLAFPNIIGLILLSPKVKRELTKYCNQFMKS